MSVTRFLLDANLSPKTTGFFRSRFGFDAVASVNRALARFFANVADTASLERPLAVVDDSRVRITQEP